MENTTNRRKAIKASLTACLSALFVSMFVANYLLVGRYGGWAVLALATSVAACALVAQITRSLIASSTLNSTIDHKDNPLEYRLLNDRPFTMLDSEDNVHIWGAWQFVIGCYSLLVSLAVYGEIYTGRLDLYANNLPYGTLAVIASVVVPISVLYAGLSVYGPPPGRHACAAELSADRTAL